MKKTISRCEECHHAKWRGNKCIHPAETFKEREKAMSDFLEIEIPYLRIKEYDYYNSNYMKLCTICRKIFKPRNKQVRSCSAFCSAVLSVKNRKQRKGLSSPAFDLSRSKQEIN